MPTVLDRQVEISEGDIDVLDLACDRYLDSGETVSSATKAELNSADLTLGTVSINAATKDVLEKTRAIGTVVSFSVQGQKITNSPYFIRVTVTTSAGRKRIVDCKFGVE